MSLLKKIGSKIRKELLFGADCSNSAEFQKDDYERKGYNCYQCRHLYLNSLGKWACDNGAGRTISFPDDTVCCDFKK